MKRHIVLLVTLLLTTLAACGQEPTSLGIDLSQLNDYRVAVTNIQTTEMAMLGQEQTTVTETYTEVAYTVVAVAEDGSTKVDVTYETMAITSTDQLTGAEEVFDSRVDSSSAGTPNIPQTNLVGKTFTIVYGANGEIIEIYDFAEIMQESMGDMAGMDAEQAERITTLFADATEDSMRESASISGGMIYPDGPVEVGSTWNAKQDMSIVFMQMMLDNTYTVNAIDDSSVTMAVSGTGTITSDDMGSFMEAMGGGQTSDMDIEFGGDIDSTGIFTVDKASGVLISTDRTTIMDMNMTMMSMSIPMKMTTVQTMQRLP